MIISRSLLFAVLMTTPLMLQAHHSVALNFSNETMTLEGTISSVSWINPHSSFVLEVTNEDGTTEEWLVEMLARIALQRGGFDFDDLQVGTQIQLTGRIGHKERTLNFTQAILPNGKVVERNSPVSRPPTQ